MDTTWQTDGDSYKNSTDFRIVEIDGVACLTCDNLEQENIEFYLPINDLFFNPYIQVVVTDKTTGKIPTELMPALILGETYYVDNYDELIDLSKYKDENENPVENLNLKKGDIVIVTKEDGGASFRLMGTDPTIHTSWAELLSRHIQWSDIQNRPQLYPPKDHKHNIYPELVQDNEGRWLLPTKYMGSINIGHYITPLNYDDLPVWESSGAIALCQDGKSYIYVTDGQSIPRWIPLKFPLDGVISVNGQHGVVQLDYEDVGASAIDHTHDNFFILSLNKYLNEDDGEQYNHQISFKFSSSSLIYNKEGLKLYIDGSEYKGLLAFMEDVLALNKITNDKIDLINLELTDKIETEKTRIDNHENSGYSGGFQKQINDLENNKSENSRIDTIDTAINEILTNKADKTELEHIDLVRTNSGIGIGLIWDGVHLQYTVEGQGPFPFA